MSVLADSAWMTAARPETIVWIPRGDTPCVMKTPGWESLDMVLMHHSLQFRRSRWKEIRRRLGRPRQESFQNWITPRSIPRYRPRHGADVADLEARDGTLFIVGSAPLFGFFAQQCEDVSRDIHSGDHTHLFEWARHERRTGMRNSMEDLTIMFIEDADWPPLNGKGPEQT